MISCRTEMRFNTHPISIETTRLARKNWPAFVMIGIAAIGSITCIAYTTRYDLIEGSRGAVRGTLDSPQFKPQSDADFVLLIAAHPKCPCFGATLSDLDEICNQSGNAKVRKVLLAYKPSQPGGEDWDDTTILQQAKASGIQIVDDIDGKMAIQYGMLTSSHIVCYDKNGQLRFSGGITMRRGHVGWNDNSQKLYSILSGPAGDPDKRPALSNLSNPLQWIETPVYGCSIVKNSDEATKRK